MSIWRQTHRDRRVVATYGMGTNAKVGYGSFAKCISEGLDHPTAVLYKNIKYLENHL